MRTCLFLSLFLLFLGVQWYHGTPVGAEEQSPPRRRSTESNSASRDGESAQLKAAAVQYRRFCARCHGADFSGRDWRDNGRRIPNFTSATWQKTRSDAQLLVSILEGKGTHMPAFSGRLRQEQARNLVRLARKARSTKPTSAGANPTDFATHYAELQKELEKLRKQFRGPDQDRSSPAEKRTDTLRPPL
jgi:mono/diheme cytochrome c family protein